MCWKIASVHIVIVNNFIKELLDRWHIPCYIINMMNEELDEQTLLLLALVCDGVEVPTDEEAEEAKQSQQGDSLIL